MNILYLPLEFPNFYSAKKLTYPVGVGLVEGFKGMSFTVVPSFYNSDLWLQYLNQIVMGQEFNQVWIEVVHSKMSKETLDFIASLAPVIVGFMIESLTMHPDEYIASPEGAKNRDDNLAMKLPYLTHAVVTDERDLNFSTVPTTFEVASVPESMIDPNLNKKAMDSDKIIFYGTTYGQRQKWVDLLGDKALVNPQGGLEDNSGVSQRFQTVTQSAFTNMHGKGAIPIGFYKKFCDDWLNIRKIMYRNWMNILWGIEGYGVLNPPHRTSVLSSRVIESMAAGKIVFSSRMYNGADFLFKNKQDILLYESAEELLDLVNFIREDDKQKIAQNAINTVLENHTTEKLVQRVLKFVEENK